MKKEKARFPDDAEPTPLEILREFISVFTDKGWLNQTLRIRHGDGTYRVFCSENKFFAYRINDQSAISWGFPGWTVCMVTHEHLMDGSQEPAPAPPGLTAHEWLRCFVSEDFELI